MRGSWLVVAAALTAAVLGCERRAPAGGRRGLQARKTPALELLTRKAHYLANAGVMVERGSTKIVFDPLFRENYGIYQKLPAEIERALFAGDPPYDGIDAVFISHHHEDHFSATDITELLRKQPQLRLFAPEQAVQAMRPLGDDIANRVTAIALEYKAPPVELKAGDILIEAVRIPHAGWPAPKRSKVENLAFRVTLGDDTTVVHLGDADTKDLHYQRNGRYWAKRRADIAFPPYWYFSSDNGRAVLDKRLRPRAAVGVHVPTEMKDPAKRPAELGPYDLFVTPGETRAVPAPSPEDNLERH